MLKDCILLFAEIMWNSNSCFLNTILNSSNPACNYMKGIGRANGATLYRIAILNIL